MTPVEGKKVFLYSVTRADSPKMVEMFIGEDGSERLGFFDWDLGVTDIREYVDKVVASPGKMVWVAKTKEGKATRTIGFIWFKPISNYWANMEGMVDSKFVQGLDKEFKRGKYTYLEDSLKAVITFLFTTTSFERIGYIDTKENPMTSLVEKVGFAREGKLRNVIKWGDKFMDGIQYSILKKDIKGV